jgi:elongation factor P
MISTSDFSKGTIIKHENQPWIILEYAFLKPGKGGAFMQTKSKNLKTNATKEISFKSNEKFEELESERKKAIYVYHNQKEVVFTDEKNKSRFSLKTEIFEEKLKYLKKDIQIDIIYVEEEPVSFILPIKITYKVKEDPGAAKGNTASGAMKKVLLENDLEVDVPMFIKQDDSIVINTDRGEYVERA